MCGSWDTFPRTSTWTDNYLAIVKTLVLPDPDRKQTILCIPAGFIKTFPENYVAEYSEESANVLRLRIVDPETPASVRRYNIVRHHQTAQLSVPRPWLRDQGVAGEGQHVLEVRTEDASPDSLFLSVRTA